MSSTVKTDTTIRNKTVAVSRRSGADITVDGSARERLRENPDETAFEVRSEGRHVVVGVIPTQAAARPLTFLRRRIRDLRIHGVM
jgi:hypothetical protein